MSVRIKCDVGFRERSLRVPVLCLLALTTTSNVAHQKLTVRRTTGAN